MRPASVWPTRVESSSVEYARSWASGMIAMNETTGRQFEVYMQRGFNAQTKISVLSSFAQWNAHCTYDQFKAVATREMEGVRTERGMKTSNTFSQDMNMTDLNC